MDSKQVAETIFNQLGRSLRIDLGIKEMFYSDEQRGQLRLILTGASETRGKRVIITLTHDDLYDVEVWRVRGVDCRKLGESKGVYADSLQQAVRRLVFPAYAQ